MKLIGYARTTINDRELAPQLLRLEAFGCETVFQDDFEQREEAENNELDRVVAQLQPGDALAVTELHRLGRSTRQLTELTSLFEERGIHLVSLEEGIDTREPMGKVYFQLMNGLSAMECALIKERTILGLNKARQNGKIGGRPKIDRKTVNKIRQMYFEKKETIQYISSKCGVSVGTCYKYIKMAEEELVNIAN